MRLFEFSTEVIPRKVDELQIAEQYIKIAVFQLHNERIFDVLNNKLLNGISVDIFTLPYDSINSDVRNTVVSRFERLRTTNP